MSEGRPPVREILWHEILPWLLVVRAVRIAFSVRVLLLATLGVLAMVAGWQLFGQLFSGTSQEDLKLAIDERSQWPWQWPHDKPVAEALGRTTEVERYVAESPMVSAWWTISGPFRELFRAEVGFVWLAYLLLCCLWTALVWGLFGGAISRIAGLFLTRHEQLGPVAGLDFSREKILSLTFAPLMPLVGVALLMIPLLLGGLVMRLGVGVLLAGILWPIALLIGFLMTVLLVGLAAGWPLMIPTISTEGTDGFDALSRAYAYVFQRPIHYLFYALLAVVMGALGALVVDAFAYVVLTVTHYGISWGLGEQVEQLVDAPVGVFTRGGAWLIALWDGLVLTVQVGFRFAFFWCGATAIYLLLRQNVDATELDEIFLGKEEAFGMPALKRDEAGVPEPADMPATPQGTEPASDTPIVDS